MTYISTYLSIYVPDNSGKSLHPPSDPLLRILLTLHWVIHLLGQSLSLTHVPHLTSPRVVYECHKWPCSLDLSIRVSPQLYCFVAAIVNLRASEDCAINLPTPRFPMANL